MEESHLCVLMKRKQIRNKQNNLLEDQEPSGLTCLGGYIWPPRSYSCSFCGKEFKSAQALGGHMNIHRRDRARLNQISLNSNTETLYSNSRVSATFLGNEVSPLLLGNGVLADPNYLGDRDDVETGLSMGMGSFGRENGEILYKCKRAKIGTVSSASLLVKECSTQHVMRSGSMEELDLELRLCTKV